MYCQSCGRVLSNQCICLNQKPITRLEVIAIVLLFHVFYVLLLRYTYSFTEVDYFLLFSRSAFFLGLFSFVLLALTFAFKRSYLAVFFGCHQSSTRSIKIKNIPFNICSRCSGIFLGFFISALVFSFNPPLIIVVLCSIPLIVDGLLQKYSTYTSTNSKRFLSGVLFSPLMILIFSGFYIVLLYLYQTII